MACPVIIRARQSNEEIQKSLSLLCNHYEEDINLIAKFGESRAQALLDAGALEAGEDALQATKDIVQCLAENVALLRQLFSEAQFRGPPSGKAVAAGPGGVQGGNGETGSADAPTEAPPDDSEALPEKTEEPAAQVKDASRAAPGGGAPGMCSTTDNHLLSWLFCGNEATESGSSTKQLVEAIDVVESPKRGAELQIVEEGPHAAEGHSGEPVVLDESLQQVIDCMVRDWTDTAKGVRDVVLVPVLDRLRKTMGRVGQGGKALPGKKVWVPGCGMCRLAADIIKSFNCTVVASDESAAMMAALASLLWRQAPCSVYPAAQSFSAGMKGMESRKLRQDCKFAQIPGLAADTWPPPRFKLELEHSRIEDVSDKAEAFDAVVTLFVLECVADLPTTVSAVSSTLKPGGCWVNCGPISAPHSPEQRWFMFEDFHAMVEANGLEVLEDSRLHSVEYLPRSATPGTRKVYEVQLPVARKPMR
eukprot:TRINITY_DN75629_c0_g1_i1.p1 TRINITY_DN75629_c0_g1~~TRINITY_DN75629_c0_g1_i1.p1  ORF type:complete len:490 (-),score=111.87 TRINITY_DN75629_c0_g1_i1:24-1451(-)